MSFLGGSSFSATTSAGKILKAVDIEAPAHLIKGGVTLDSRLQKWSAGTERRFEPQPFLVTINLKTQSFSQFLPMVASWHDISEEEAGEFGLLSSDGIFMTDASFQSLQHGFTLKFTASPNRMARLLWEDAGAFPSSPSADSSRVDAALKHMNDLANQKVFLEALDGQGILHEILSALADRSQELSNNTRALLLSLTCSLKEAGLDWSRLPSGVFLLVSSLIRSSSFPLDVDSLTQSIRLLLLALDSNDQQIRNIVLSEVSVESIPSLVVRAASSSPLCLSVLSLLSALFRSSSQEGKTAVIKFAGGAEFRRMVQSVHELGPCSPEMECELLSALVLRLSPYADEATSYCPHSTIQTLLESAPLAEETDDAKSLWEALLRQERMASLAGRSLLFILHHNPNLLVECWVENGLRARGSECAAWQLIPLSLHISEVISHLFALHPQDSRDWLSRSVAVALEDASFEKTFALALQHSHAIWRQMHAQQGEEQKVSIVVGEMLHLVSTEKNCKSVAELGEALRHVKYSRMQQLWEDEQAKRDMVEQGQGLIHDMRERLAPQIRALVLKNRVNFLRQGLIFRKLHKGKTMREEKQLWKLEESGRWLRIREVDEGDGRAEERIPISDILSASFEQFQEKRAAAAWKLRFRLCNGREITVASEEERAVEIWTDGLNALAEAASGETRPLSERSSKEADRLLDIDIRVRLMQCKPRPLGRLPPLPSSLDWVKPHLVFDASD